jgi:tRNA dimethylallyltransferase
MTMALPSNRPAVALIAGPTASGKSALALALAEAIGGTIVNADASQLYADLRILSARPTAAEEARVPHRLFGIRDGAEPASAADWARLAAHAIDQIHGESRIPILVGGSGLYIRTLLEGIAPVPDIDPTVRSTVRALPVADAYAALLVEDPARRRAPAPRPTAPASPARWRWSAPPATRSRTGRRSAPAGSRPRPPRPAVAPPAARLLHAACDRRFAAMLDAGAVDEVARLLERGLDPALPVMRAIGVPEIAAFLRGLTDRETMIARATAPPAATPSANIPGFATSRPHIGTRVPELGCRRRNNVARGAVDMTVYDTYSRPPNARGLP